MSAVEDRLAATLAKHRWSPVPCGRDCLCEWRADPGMRDPRGQHDRHVAAVIASSDDLAVISLPEPQTEDDEGETVTFWPFSDSTTVRTYPRYGEVGWSVHGEPEEPVTPSWTRDFAAALLAAAKAAEAVSDRG
ncbi:hypothetical protein [Tsukamurella hominis]|uniref:hypothetical protein n=1 Tax=Tsukamurella hominis TaxID=1970232 RepID=UPI0039EA7097